MENVRNFFMVRATPILHVSPLLGHAYTEEVKAWYAKERTLLLLQSAPQA